MSEIKIRRVEARDLKRYKKLSDDEAWNIEMDIFEKMLETNPNGFWCAEELSSNQVVSFCGAVDIHENRAILSTFITDPTCRGRGIGSLVLKKVMEVYQNHEMIVNASDGREPLYARFGMPHWMYQALQIICEPLETFPTSGKGKSVVVTELENIDEVFDYDRVVSKEDRRLCLKWFYETSECSLVAREKGKLLGYAFIRKAVDGITFQENHSIETRMGI